ncbi:flagellar basal body rod protein FlgB [Alkalihalobacillus pseudalcaliphilus]|nr:flagellar basal body rod protein FlgB [Alkalihalobacillus pseudalcaliphilus]KMK77212.1 flagellar basal body rod protein FlgB [Alkalihalobacillus pseudalcaliphilus]
MNLFSGTTMQMLEQGLRGSTMQHKAISNNIANVDTPNYKAQRVSFDHVLQNELAQVKINAHKTDRRHFDYKSSTASSPMIETQKTTYNHNGANVDVDVEMAELAKNQIYYNSLIDRLNGSYSNLKMVIRGGS